MTLLVGVAGLGAIGSVVCRILDAGVPGLRLEAVASGDPVRAAARCAGFATPPPVLSPEALAKACDIVVDCAPPQAFRSIAAPALKHSRLLLTVSAAAVLEHPDLVTGAQAGQGQIQLATGALLGLDAVRAAAEGVIHSAKLVTTKPPRSLAKARFVIDQGIDLSNLRAPLRLFAGVARDGARAFPSNVNVAAALSLAGIGPDRTGLEIWADPAATRNCHEVTVDADSARFTMRIENIPSDENPASARIAALSAVAALRRLTAPLVAGS